MVWPFFFLSPLFLLLLSTWSEVVLFLQCARARSIIYGQMKMEKNNGEERKRTGRRSQVCRFALKATTHTHSLLLLWVRGRVKDRHIVYIIRPHETPICFPKKVSFPIHKKTTRFWKRIATIPCVCSSLESLFRWSYKSSFIPFIFSRFFFYFFLCLGGGYIDRRGGRLSYLWASTSACLCRIQKGSFPLQYKRLCYPLQVITTITVRITSSLAAWLRVFFLLGSLPIMLATAGHLSAVTPKRTGREFIFILFF